MKLFLKIVPFRLSWAMFVQNRPDYAHILIVFYTYKSMKICCKLIILDRIQEKTPLKL